MKKLLAVMAMLGAMAFAQTSPVSNSFKDKAPKDKTVKGCLHKDGDNFWLATRVGKYHVMSSNDLSAHDGHEVKVTGKYSTGALPGAANKVKHLEAGNVEMVADKCAMGTKKVKMEGDEMSKKKTKK